MEEQNDLEQVSTADVLAEVERRQAEKRRLKNKRLRRLVIGADRFIFWLSKHWLALFNTLAFLYVGLPTLAPILMALGIHRPASIIYLIYRPLCHQLPQRSWFLFGPKLAYRLPELMERGVVSSAWTRDFIGNEAMGYKMAFCQRDFAIYGTIFLAGIVYGLLRRRWDIKPLPLWVYIGVGIVPMGIDGGLQLISYILPLLLSDPPIRSYETTPLMRTVTGALFGWATVWLAYPYFHQSMEEIRRSLQQRFGWGD